MNSSGKKSTSQRGRGASTPQRLPASVYRRRRIAVAIGALSVVGLIIFLVKVAIALTTAAVDVSETPKEVPTVNPTVDLAACDSQLLTGILTPQSSVIKPGWKLDVAAKVKANDPKIPCLGSGSVKKLGMQVLQGDTVIFDSSACATHKRRDLLFGQKVSWETSFSWDGQIHAGVDKKCGALEPAPPGTYTLQLVYLGKPMGQATQITVTDSVGSN